MSRPLHISLWVAQGFLALAFGAAGTFKSTAPIPELLANGMTFVARHPEALVRFIGVSELLGAIGLILPSALRIAPRLSGVAGAALALVMVLAMGEHTMNGEFPALVPNIVLGGLSAFVAWGRLVGSPISGR